MTPSQQLALLGDGFAVNTEATVLVYSSPIVLGAATTDSTGALSLDVVIPATLEQGSHNIVATGVAPDGTQRTIRMPVSLVSTPVVTPPTASAPKILGVGAGTRRITLTFGAAMARAKVKVIGYEFTVSSGRHWKTLKTTGTSRRSVTITGLANGRRYGVQVRAVTSAGPGMQAPWSG